MSSVLPLHLLRNTSRQARAVFTSSLHIHQNVNGPRLTLRLFHACPALSTSRDQSTIDFAYFPQEKLEDPTANTVIRVPILPNNYSERNHSRHREPVVESVRRPEIFTVSANGTHIDSPSAMSDVVDNHAADIDHFDLTKHVTNAASKAVRAGTQHMAKQSVLRSLWAGLVDDVFGEKNTAHA